MFLAQLLHIDKEKEKKLSLTTKQGGNKMKQSIKKSILLMGVLFLTSFMTLRTTAFGDEKPIEEKLICIKESSSCFECKAKLTGNSLALHEGQRKTELKLHKKAEEYRCDTDLVGAARFLTCSVTTALNKFNSMVNSLDKEANTKKAHIYNGELIETITTSLFTQLDEMETSVDLYIRPETFEVLGAKICSTPYEKAHTESAKEKMD